MYRRPRTGHLPFSYVHGEEYKPYEISETLLENTHWASKLHSRRMWDTTDSDLIRGYNHIARGVDKRYIFVIGVVRDIGYKQLTLRVTHSRTEIPEEFLDKTLTDMDYHLSLVLWPWDKDPNSENYVPALCSPRNCLAFNVIDVNRKKRVVSAAVSAIYYDGIAPPYRYDTGMIANMLHSDFGSSVIKRCEIHCANRWWKSHS